MNKIPKLYVGAMNDALFITDVKPVPNATDSTMRNHPEETVCIPLGAGTVENIDRANRLVEAWNAVQ